MFVGRPRRFPRLCSGEFFFFLRSGRVSLGFLAPLSDVSPTTVAPFSRSSFC